MILLIVFYVLTAFSRVCLYYKPTYVGFALSTSSIFVITTEGEGKRNVRGGRGEHVQGRMSYTHVSV